MKNVLNKGAKISWALSLAPLVFLIIFLLICLFLKQQELQLWIGTFSYVFYLSPVALLFSLFILLSAFFHRGSKETIFIAIIALLISLPGSLWFYHTIRYHYTRPIDAILSFMISKEEATIWAPDYSEHKFSGIKNGMSQGEVLSKIGQPLEKKVSKEIYWRYTKPKHYGSYHLRLIVFNMNKKVSIKVREIYID